MRGDPAAACRGKKPSLECPDLHPRPVPPLADTAEAKAAEDDGLRLQRELDAKRAAEDYDAMAGKLKKYVASEYARVGYEKAKEFIEEKSEALGQTIATVERVKEQGSIVKDYAMNTLDSIKDKASNAACTLASGSVECMDAYYEANQRQNKDIEKLRTDTRDFVGEQFLYTSVENQAKETLPEAKEKLSETAVRRFFGSF